MYLFHLRSNLTGQATFVPNVLTPDECRRVIESGEREIELAPGRVEDNQLQSAIRKSDIGWFSPQGEHRWLFERIRDCINAVNSDWFRYDLVGFEGIQFTKYSAQQGKSDFYSSHVDLKGTDMGTIRKLSFTIQLSEAESYEGGDVLLYESLTQPVAFRRNQGSITFFPAYAVHEVVPVTRGVRHSLVGWAHGPPFL